MRRAIWVSILFLICGLYDGVLGLLFLVAPDWAFERYGVTPPNHFGYVQFPAALLLVFAWLYLTVAFNPQRNRNLIPYGIGLKVAYFGVVFFHWVQADIPDLWKSFAVIDAVMAVLFVWAYMWLGRKGANTPVSSQ